VGISAGVAYAEPVLRNLRDPSGRPSERTRVVALLVAVGLIVVTAPAIIVVVRWLAGLIW
jgi:hypothetical protein